MSALHYASFFDAAPVLENLLRKSKGVDVDSTCEEYENGTALHIAASNIGVNAARVLLRYGADQNLKDDLARTPADCIPESEDFSVIPNAEDLIEEMHDLLAKGYTAESAHEGANEGKSNKTKKSTGAVSGRTALKALGLKV